MPRYAFQIEYDGGPFKGWQAQDDLPTVQGALETALRALEPDFDRVAAAGRTDTGVHALAQVAHADMSKQWDPDRLGEALNYHLKPLPVAITSAKQVDDEWHARFDATERRYLFRLLSRRVRAPFEHGRVWQVGYALGLDAMREGAQHLIGQHDFTTFRAAQCQAKSPIKTLDSLEITSHPVPHGIEFHFQLRARSFLHNQVRSFVGTLERVGAGAWAPEDVKTALEARDRSACGPVCPPGGLYLAGVGYPNDPFS